MKKTNKIISIILAMILAFSSLPLMASAGAIDDDNVDTVDKLIQGDNLGNLVEWILTNLNPRKEKATGSLLRIAFLLLKDESIQKHVAKNPLIATDEELASYFISYANENLPTWTKEIYNNDFVKWLAERINLNLTTINGLVDSIYKIGSFPGLGDVSNINESALKNVSVEKSGNLNTINALIQFLADNTGFIKKALNANINLDGIAGILFNGMVNNTIKEKISPDAIKKILCDVLTLDYNIYKNYTADEIAAVAFLKILTGKDSVSKSEAEKLMNKTIYDLLEDYAGPIYTNLLVGPLNNNIKNMLIENIKPLDDEYDNILDKVFNWDYEFKADTFDAILGAGKGNTVSQLNKAVIALLKVILTDDAFKTLALEDGGNDKLNSNLTKTFRYILPLISKLKNLGVDLSGFTADKVKNMSAEEMAVAVLKLFFKGWFNLSTAQMQNVNSAKTLEQLGVLAACYIANNSEWVPPSIKSASNIKNVSSLDDKACIDLIFEIGTESIAKYLEYNKTSTNFSLPADTSAWKGINYLDQIVDWILGLIKGIPGISDLIPAEMNKLDEGSDPFTKLNAILNSVIDLSFISGCGNEYFNFDIETMFMDKFLVNLLDFDIEAAVAVLAENEESEIFNKKVNVAIIDFADNLITAVFSIKSPVTPGDVNFKNGPTADDARLALRASVDLETFNLAEKIAADVTKDGKVTSLDARSILRAAVNLETLS